MPRSRAVTREQIIKGAYALFYRQGFARVTMDEIAAHAGVTKRTLYAHFDSKDTLLGEALHHHHELALEWIEKWSGKLDRGDPSSIDQLFTEIALWSSRQRWSGAGFTRLVMELADLSGHPARKIAKLHKAAVERRLASAFGSAEAGAEVMVVIEGTLALLLVHGDRRYAEIGAAAAKKLMRCAVGEG